MDRTSSLMPPAQPTEFCEGKLRGFEDQFGNKCTVRVTTMMSTVKLYQRMDLKYIAQHAQNCVFNTAEGRSNSDTSSILINMRNPFAAVKLFKDGTMVIFGGHSEESARRLAERMRNRLTNMGYEGLSLEHFRVTNIAGVCSMNFDINVSKLYEFTRETSTYCPEIGVGMDYRMVEPSCVLTVFHTGKVNIKGVSKVSDIFEAAKNFFNVAVQFKNTVTKRRRNNDMMTMMTSSTPFTQTYPPSSSQANTRAATKEVDEWLEEFNSMT